MDERGGTTVVRRPERPRAAPAREPTPQTLKRPERRAQESRPGGFDLSSWVFGIVDRPDETPAEGFRQGLVRREPPAAREEPRARHRGDRDPGAHRQPAARPAAAPAPPAPPPPAPSPRTAEPRPARRGSTRGSFDLAAWVFGLVPRTDDEPVAAPEPTRARPPRPRPPARRPLTMPDLFEGAPVPPCLDDD